jgi:microcystin-dependent protein
MPVKRKTINLTVSGNTLTATNALTGNATAEAGVQGEDSAVWLHAEIPQEWQDLTVRLKVIAINGAYDESGTPVANSIDMPLRQGVTVPGPLTVCLLGSDATGVRRTADSKALVIASSAIPANAVAEFKPIDFEALKEVVDMQVVHTVTGSGGVLVTKTDGTSVNVGFNGTVGDMLQANFANGSGGANPTKCDHAVYADGALLADAAKSAQAGSALEAALAAKQPVLSAGANGGNDILSGAIIKSLKAAGIVTLSADDNTITIKAQDYPGTIKAYAGETAPPGTLLCDGSAISRSAYAALFNVLGIIWGAGNGSTTFNIPNFMGKTLIGYDEMEKEFNMLAKTGGEKAHALTAAENGLHAHTGIFSGATELKAGVAFAAGSAQSGLSPAGTVSASTGSSGTGTAHNNLQPYSTVNFLIVY